MCGSALSELRRWKDSSYACSTVPDLRAVRRGMPRRRDRLVTLCHKWYERDSESDSVQVGYGEDLQGPFVVSYCCLNETTSRKFLREQTEEEIRQSGILRVMIPCVSRLSTIDLLSPFELGADKVCVIACSENGCFYPGAEELLAKRVNRVGKFLDQIGVGKDNLQLFKTEGSAEEHWPRIWEEFRSTSANTIARSEQAHKGDSR